MSIPLTELLDSPKALGRIYPYKQNCWGMARRAFSHWGFSSWDPHAMQGFSWRGIWPELWEFPEVTRTPHPNKISSMRLNKEKALFSQHVSYSTHRSFFLVPCDLWFRLKIWSLSFLLQLHVAAPPQLPLWTLPLVSWANIDPSIHCLGYNVLSHQQNVAKIQMQTGRILQRYLGRC